MGGRGASNTQGSRNMPVKLAAQMPQKPQKPKTAVDMTDISELRTYAKDTLGIKLASTLDNADYGLVQQAVADYEFFKTEFPQWDVMTGIRMQTMNPSENASTNGEIINLSTWYQKPDAFAQRIDAATARGYYPEGTTNKTTAVHEMGHTFEQALINKYMPDTGSYLDRWDRIDAWNRHVYSKKLISEAAKAAKKTADGKGKKNAELISQVSRYATTNSAETLAECVRDYYINRGNAKPLSREVWNILKKEFG